MMDLVLTGKEPKIWVEKIAIFESREHQLPVREVTLSKGINLVWAREYPGDDIHLGHGVGKTSFCRLIRYSLGEAGFATKEFKERVLYALQNAYVAAIVWIMGKQWVVARPLDGKKKKFVVHDGDLFSVFSSKNQLEWAQYQQAIKQAVLTAPLILPGSGNEITWGNILAWCTRDQEAYLGDYYDWRSSRCLST